MIGNIELSQILVRGGFYIIFLVSFKVKNTRCLYSYSIIFRCTNAWLRNELCNTLTTNAIFLVFI